MVRSGVVTRPIPRQAGWVLAALALLALRIPHLSGPLDDPHSWRQCDTAYYSLDFYRHGVDLLHPAVCWLGSHRTLILEFPLPEAISALLYRAFGPDPLWDRVVSLAFFALATGYLFAIVRLLASERIAWLATLAYLVFPLGQFFSRAPQADFAATAFAHGVLLHGALAIVRRSTTHAAWAAAHGTLAALIKAPYLLPVLAPLGWVVLAAPTLVTVGRGALALGIPALAFLWWRGHVTAVNAAAPDWNFLPGYYKEVNPLWWYFGSWTQRLEGASWVVITRRLVYHVATPAGLVLAALGLLARALRQTERPASGASVPLPGPRAFALVWGGACLFYLLLFFPLNVIHHYYQIPFLAPAALLVGLGADLLWHRLPRLAMVPAGSLALVLFLGLAVRAVGPLGYYRVDWLRVEAGRLIQEHVPAGELVVTSDYGSGHSDPRLLFRADRHGWPLAITDLEPDRLRRLAELGARTLAVVTDSDHPHLAPPTFLDAARVERVPIRHQGRTLGMLDLFALNRLFGPAAP